MKITGRVVLWTGTSVALIVTAVSNCMPLLGAVAGLWLGYMNIERLYKEVRSISGLDLRAALKKMQRKFFIRLGIVTLIAVMIAKWQPDMFLGLIVVFIISLMVFLLMKAQQAIR
ncbi:MAG: hypothetical protein LBT22_05155 [Peptococcaceae bacterium]|jgi:membrane protein YqaA with SNARE-associated domain|nr:hypothetical protein [Peptococcaceae bacterium]